MENVQILNSMVGKTFQSVQQVDETIVFDDGKFLYKMYHEQDCCEDVVIESIVGDLQDLVGTPLLVAEEVSSEATYKQHKSAPEETEYDNWCGLWTFYKFATIKGYIDIRWFGSTERPYSVKVTLKVTPK